MNMLQCGQKLTTNVGVQYFFQPIITNFQY